MGSVKDAGDIAQATADFQHALTLQCGEDPGGQPVVIGVGTGEFFQGLGSGAVIVGFGVHGKENRELPDP